MFDFNVEINLFKVHNENGFVRFMATTLAYGFFGDIIQQSEDLRFVGPARCNLSGFFQFIRNKSYRVQLTITPPDERYSTKILIQNLFEYSQKSFRNQIIHSENSSLPIEIKLEGQYRSINCLNMSCRCQKSNYGMSPSVHLGIFIIPIHLSFLLKSLFL
jgi:ceramide kinase